MRDAKSGANVSVDDMGFSFRIGEPEPGLPSVQVVLAS
ncbi:hypothetical protein ApDm4_2613 [Acetobacter pomorum]|nr:hypothetical protein ApDm4_2613 [Acetobacter pomorum]